MTDEILDHVVSLTQILEEETSKLTAPGRHADLREIVAAKSRLVGMVEHETVKLNRERPNWLAELPVEQRAELAEAMGRLRDASVSNAAILERQIALSAEMMAAVATEVQRLTGTSNATYGAQGALFRNDQATPIALNTSL